MPRRRVAIGRPRRLAARRERADVWLQQAGVGLGPAAVLGRERVRRARSRCWSLAALTGSVFVALVPAVAVALLPRGYFGRRRRARMREVQVAWPDGLRDLVASIAAGLLADAGGHEPRRDRPAGAARRLRAFPAAGTRARHRPGAGAVKEDLADPTSDRVLEVLILAQERGGAIVRDILDDLVDATTRDLKLLDELETEGLEMRINARAVVVLPWLVLVALTARAGRVPRLLPIGGRRR